MSLKIADLLTLTNKIVNQKFHFLCSVGDCYTNSWSDQNLVIYTRSRLSVYWMISVLLNFEKIARKHS